MTTRTRTEPRPRGRDLFAAEWIKLWSLRSTPWVLLLCVLGIVAINGAAAVADYQNYPHYGAGIRALFDPWWAMRDAFTLSACEVLILVASTIGVTAVGSEYSTGMVRVTFAAVPARRSVLAAKATVVGTVLLAVGAVTVLTSFFVTQAILSGRHAGMSVTDPGVLRILGTSALVAPVAALVGMGIGVLVRHLAAAVVGTTFLLGLAPLLVDSHTRRWVIDLHNAMPLAAWQRLVEPGKPFDPAIDPTVAGSWIVFAGWPLAAALCAAVVIHRRDV
jgi:ABC-2 type transport system permease protein